MKMRCNLFILIALFFGFLLLGSIALITEARGQAKQDPKH